NGFFETVGDTYRKTKDTVNAVIPKYKKGTVRRMIHEELRTRFDSLGLITEGEIDTTTYKNFKKITPDQHLNVFGWHPYWMGNVYKAYNFELLTMIAYFSYDLNPETGAYRNFQAINDWRATELVDLAHEKGCKVLLTVSNHGATNNELFLNHPLPDLVQQTLIDSIFALLELKGADGINLNFENVGPNLQKQYNRFILNLSDQLRKRNPEWVLTVSLPAFDFNEVYDFLALDSQVDLFVIMGYDFHTRTTPPGPVAPLLRTNPKQYLDVSLSVQKYLDAGIQPADLVLGLPYYGAMWEVDNGPTRFVKHLTYRELKSQYLDTYAESIEYIDSTQSNKLDLYYSSDSPAHLEIWFDDERTMRQKFDWIAQQQIGGVGIWALGYDNGYDDLWLAIDQTFTEVTIPASNRIHITVIRAIRKYSTVIIVGLVFLTLFMVIGFLYSLVDWKVRESMFQARTSRWLYIGAFFCLFLVLLALFGFLPSLWGWIVIGLLIGLLLTVAVTRWVGVQYSRRP
ncbi:MAG: glycosyl hydrolase family 18 protein, partial [Bacteroidota bacterium]